MSKKTPNTTNNIWFKNPNIPTREELIQYGKELDKQYPGDTYNRGFLRQKLKSEIGVCDPWEKVGLSWTEYKRQCGFAPSRAAMKLLNQSSRHASVSHLVGPSNERLTWGSRFIKPDNGERFKTVMGASDFHDIEMDEFAVRMFLRKLQYVQPDVVALNGDLFDAPEFSKHYQNPAEYELVKRIKKVHDLLDTIRNIVPDAQIDLIEGNHEARIARHILEVTPATAHILDYFHGMGIRELLGLDKYEVNYVAKGDLYAFTDAQLKASVLESERVYWNTLWVRHHPPKQTNVSIPGFHGHHHSHEVSTFNNPIYGAFEWHQLGAMHRRQASYTDGRKWNLGFTYVIVDTWKQRAVFDYTYVGDTFCQLDNEFHERHEDEYYPALIADIDNRQNNGHNSPSIIKKAMSSVRKSSNKNKTKAGKTK